MSLKSYALTTVDRLAAYLEITPTAAQSTLLENIINSVTDYIEHYTGRRFQLTTYTNEIYNGDGGRTLVLRNFPVDSTASFQLDSRNTISNEDNWSGVNGQLYMVDNSSGIVQAVGKARFGRDVGAFRVSYTAGYDFDNTTTFLSDTEAADVEYAAWRMAAAAFKQKNNSAVNSERIGDYSVTYAKMAFEDPEVTNILDKYTRLGVGAGVSPFNY